MDWPNDMEPLLELPTDLRDKDMPEKSEKGAENAQESVFVDYNDLNKGVISGTDACSPFLARLQLMI